MPSITLPDGSQRATLAIVTAKDDDGLHLIRHSTAHLMAQAVKQLYPEAQVTIGPVIEDGFYYDFAYERPRDAAVEFFSKLSEDYKAEIISDIPQDEVLSLYEQGDFTDLCRGPHVPDTGKLGHFKLMKLAGAYWRGDSNNAMLQRIYGTAWTNKKDLKAYLHRLEEAEKRDHRKIGKQLDLFHLQEEAPGMVFWHPAGWSIYQSVQQYMRKRQIEQGYKEINTPQIVDMSLWEKSGHADKFGDDMFAVSSEERKFAIKPMNCPCHVQVFNQGLRSYRELPLRLAEFGSCHRNELSGALHGIMRVRGFVQDDAHIFCTEEQIQPESAAFIDFLHSVYEDFGFTEVIYRLSTRPENRVGSDADWDKSEKALADALDAKNLDWKELPGEGAFYGPKIEFSLKDCIGRVWQCGTLQVDFSMPGRLGAEYVDARGDRQTPIMLHRALLGSFERFIGILIEQHEGKMPLWLAPNQIRILNITDKQLDFCKNLEKTLSDQGFRAQTDLRNEKIGLKIREATLDRVPYMLVIGDKEIESGMVSVRTRDAKELGPMDLDTLMTGLTEEVASCGRDPLKSN